MGADIVDPFPHTLATPEIIVSDDTRDEIRIIMDVGFCPAAFYLEDFPLLLRVMTLPIAGPYQASDQNDHTDEKRNKSLQFQFIFSPL